MDGENNGKPYEQMDDLGVLLFLGNTNFLLGAMKQLNHVHKRLSIFFVIKTSFFFVFFLGWINFSGCDISTQKFVVWHFWARPSPSKNQR